MIPTTVTPTTDPCVLARQWGLAEALADALVRMASTLEFPFSIISGLRTIAQQNALRAAGKPAAPNNVSTHLACPATGADLWPSIAVTSVVKARMGAEAVFSGLRWGGGSPIDPETGIPDDWNHFDLGPRT